jgi:uncharacterized protein YndB with AHSA1/START domain
VWRALTEPELLSKWLLPVLDFKLAPGAAFRFQAPPQPGWDGAVQCELLSLEPGRKLSYRWVVGPLDTVVTFSLAPSGPGSRLTVVQSGFREDQKRNFGGARYGWNQMGARLLELLAAL